MILSLRASAAEVDELDYGKSLAEEGGAEALELLDGVSGVEGARGLGGRAGVGQYGGGGPGRWR